MELKNGMIVVSPVTNGNSIKKGEEFTVFNVKQRNNVHLFGFYIEIQGSNRFCLLKNCEHINGKDWIIKKKI